MYLASRQVHGQRGLEADQIAEGRPKGPTLMDLVRQQCAESDEDDNDDNGSKEFEVF